MSEDYLTETSPLIALDKIFKNSPKHSLIKLISCSDKYGDMFITETQKIFIPYINNNIQKAHLHQIKGLLNKPRRKKNITVGGLKKYIDYTIKKLTKEYQKDGRYQ